MNVIAIHQCGEFLRLPLATEDQSLLRGEILSSAPLSDFEGHMGIGLLDFLVGGPSGCTMLPIAHSAGFDIAKGIVMGHHGQPADDKEHRRSRRDQDPDTCVQHFTSFHS